MFPLLDCVASFAKNAPSIAMGERLAADRLRLMRCSWSREKPQAMKSDNDHKSDWVPVSAMADTSAWMSEGRLEMPLSVPPGRERDMVIKSKPFSASPWRRYGDLIAL